MRIVKFGADWCFPCRVLSQTFEKLNIPVEEINIDEFPELAEKYEIGSIPVTIFFDDNENILLKRIGLIAPNELQTLYNTYDSNNEKRGLDSQS